MKVVDPVCGMQIDPDKAEAKLEYSGATYWFCSLACRTQFAAAPAKYLSPGAAAPRRRQEDR